MKFITINTVKNLATKKMPDQEDLGEGSIVVYHNILDTDNANPTRALPENRTRGNTLKTFLCNQHNGDTKITSTLEERTITDRSR